MFQICVSSWVFVSGMGFGVWFRHLGSWIWDWWVSAFGCGFQHLAVADFVAVGLFCGVLWICFVVAVGLLVMLCWCLGGGCAAIFFSCCKLVAGGGDGGCCGCG